MKVRTGFVSNSSSNSFVCDITGVCETTTEGMCDIGFAECVNGHTFLFGDWADVKAYFDDHDYYDSIPEDICPVCNGKAKGEIVKRMNAMMKSYKITAQDLVFYMLKT